jgi:hypothetical protein
VAQRQALRAKTPADPASERLFLGLRLTEGIEGPFPDSIHQFIRDGLLEQSGPRVRLTPRGIMVSNEVFQQFIGEAVPSIAVGVPYPGQNPDSHGGDNDWSIK